MPPDTDDNAPARIIPQGASKLRFPKLFVLVLLLFLVDLVVPDFIPLFDEIVLGLLSAMLGMWRQKTRGEPHD